MAGSSKADKRAAREQRQHEREERAARRRRTHGPEGDRQQNLIYLAAGGILALVILVVVVGVVMTVILPPRAHVLTVGDADFSASDIADRAKYLVTSGSGDAQQDPANTAIDSLIGQEILFQVGAPMVAEVTDQEVRDAIAQQLGLSVPQLEETATPEPTPETTPETTPEASATGEATETAEVTATELATETPTATPAETGTPTPEATPYTDQQYADALAAFLRQMPIGRTHLEEIIRAGLIEERLEEQFRGELPESGDQFELLMVQTDDRAAAQRLIDAVRGGADFAETATAEGILESGDAVTELGWFAPTSLNERVIPALQDLQTGDVSDVVEDARRVGYEVYFMVERTTDQPYDEAVKDQLARRALNDWKEAQEATVGVERDLSSGEDQWIRDQVLDYLRG